MSSRWMIMKYTLKPFISIRCSPFDSMQDMVRIDVWLTCLFNHINCSKSGIAWRHWSCFEELTLNEIYHICSFTFSWLHKNHPKNISLVRQIMDAKVVRRKKENLTTRNLIPILWGIAYAKYFWLSQATLPITNIPTRNNWDWDNLIGQRRHHWNLDDKT